MSISFSGSTFEGLIANVDYFNQEGIASGDISIPESLWGVGFHGGMTISPVGDWPLHWGGALQDSVHHCSGWDAATSWGYGNNGAVRWAAVVQPYTLITTQYYGTEYKVWALVIPSLDAEALYIPTRHYTVANSGSKVTAYKEEMGVGSTPVGFTCAWTPEEIAADPGNKSGYDGWWNIQSGIFNCPWQTPMHTGAPCDTVSSESIFGTVSDVTNVMCFNSSIAGETGTPGGSYYALFNCSREYPYYDRGMWMRTSFGKRYIGSELPANPESVTNLSFVGWA